MKKVLVGTLFALVIGLSVVWLWQHSNQIRFAIAFRMEVRQVAKGDHSSLGTSTVEITDAMVSADDIAAYQHYCMEEIRQSVDHRDSIIAATIASRVLVASNHELPTGIVSELRNFCHDLNRPQHAREEVRCALEHYDRKMKARSTQASGQGE